MAEVEFTWKDRIRKENEARLSGFAKLTENIGDHEDHKTWKNHEEVNGASL